MQSILNDLGQPLGTPLPDWTPPPYPLPVSMSGRFCVLEPLTEQHAEALYAANSLDTGGRSWTYLPYGPFTSFAQYREWIATSSRSTDPLFFAIIERNSDKAVGIASYLRIAPASGSIEVGHLHYSDLLKRSPAATEAMFLLMQHAFTLGYRRYEWKCHALNGPSRAAAQRLGFTFEGIFRQATVVKGHSRDTAWYSIIDSEWPALQRVIAQWLAPENFDAQGQQQVRLSTLTGQISGRPRL